MTAGSEVVRGGEEGTMEDVGHREGEYSFGEVRVGERGQVEVGRRMVGGYVRW